MKTPKDKVHNFPYYKIQRFLTEQVFIVNCLTLVCSETFPSLMESSDSDDMLSLNNMAESIMLTAGARPFRYTSDCVLSQRLGVVGVLATAG